MSSGYDVNRGRATADAVANSLADAWMDAWMASAVASFSLIASPVANVAAFRASRELFVSVIFVLSVSTSVATESMRCRDP